MKKINEQSKRYGAPISHAPQMPSPTPKTTFNKSSYINKTVNLYKDKNETQLIRQVKIKDVIPKGKFIEINTNMVVPYTYDCGELYLKPSAGEFYLLYNKKLTDKLKTDFCTKSSGGANVPKADFASNGQPAQGQTMAEGKKVIRITEEDMVRLVKRVINEQSVMNELKPLVKTLINKYKICGSNSVNKKYPFDPQVKRFQVLANKLQPAHMSLEDGILNSRDKEFLCGFEINWEEFR